MTGAIPVKEAQEKILANCHPLPSELVQGLSKARGRILANDVKAPRDIPQAPTSIVDGYAVCSSDFEGQSIVTFSCQRLRTDGAAGAASQLQSAELQKREAAYVTTGGLLPPRADAVRPEEESTVVVDANIASSSVQLTCCEEGKWVRLPGSDMKAGASILPAGHRLSAMDLSVLAATGGSQPGNSSVHVHRRPKVAVLSTGRELLDPESELSELPKEKIFDANRHMLMAMAEEEGAEISDFGIIGDDRVSINKALRDAAAVADIVICSGGVSEGDFDFVRPALREMATMLFERLVMRPGKPASCAVLEREASVGGVVLLFGLPGNPASAAVTFKLLVAPALQRLAGQQCLGQPRLQVKVKETVVADPSRAEYVRAALVWEGSQLVAMHTGLQRSSRAASLAGATALLELSAGQRVQAGETATALILSSLPSNSCNTVIDPRLTQQLEAATFRQLVSHFQANPDVQNIDLMNLSGFCRNCLSKWYMKAANDGGVAMDYDAARELVYGMPYDSWKKLHQTPATAAQTTAFEKSGHGHADGGSGCCKKGAKGNDSASITPNAHTEHFEASALRKLVAHLRENASVQNIDLMNLSGFCRNCISKWYRKAAEERGLHMDYDAAREIIYGMPYEVWKNLHQNTASSEQLQAFNEKVGTAPHPAPKRPKHSDVCTGGGEQGKALEALEGASAASSYPQLRVGVLTVSDRASAKVYADLSGPAVAETLRQALKEITGFPVGNLICVKHLIVPDEQVEIERGLRDWSAGVDALNLILTTGGTGCAPRDVTPEATKAVCDKDATGIALATLQAGAQHHPLALASRLYAGIRRRTLILNLPGNPSAVEECLRPVVPLLLRAVSLCDQPSERTNA